LSGFTLAYADRTLIMRKKSRNIWVIKATM